ncbi:M16 family metallopeptidase [Glaciecola petra]|uniref:Pitrilysin family protein n=1 Tax=Glaciecola petra TaxID=3075602 RepID=A0ABU2ZMP2_9ALTE|nr:pitrilysin family protein [Aestuariibacter sp. P117]MDT0593897.1 pitrilysin family protein [Aestuariibacter sp. P117]
MKKSSLFSMLVVVYFMLAACQQPQVDKDKSSFNQAELTGDAFKYHQYELENGLTVILHPDGSDPLVNVNVTYHVGSAREEYGRSGFAHFFEHMMFQGSENVADEEHFKLITEAGGNLNGTTNSDRTNYFQTIPANQLEKVLWLEADRMGFLLPAVTQEKFENQRETVKNERGQRVDNRPYGLRSERVREALYPKGHPYSWSTIGYVEDLDRVNVDDLKRFFKRWYGPNNAVLTIGGDIDIAQTKQWISKYFGPIPRGPEVKSAKKQPSALDETRYITLEDKVHLPLLQVTFPTVYSDHPDEPALDVLASILGSGRTSLLYKNMVKNGFAVQAQASHPCRELACEFLLLALANPSKVSDLSALNDIINASLDEFEKRGVEDDDLQRVKTSIETSSIYNLQSVAGKVGVMASSQIYRGTPDTVQFDLDRYNAVTEADVMRVYNTFIKGKNAVVLSIVPTGQSKIAAAQSNFSLQDRVIPVQQEMANIGEAPVIIDSFDRSIQPSAQASKAVNVPQFWETTLGNGIKVLGLESNETPTLSFSLSLEGGVLLDPLDKTGLASMTAAMMNESTLNFSSEELSNELRLIGSSISFSSNGRYTNIYVNTLSKHVDKTLALLQEKLFNPAFLEADFKRLKQRNIQAMEQSLNNPSTLMSRAREMVLYGKESRLGIPDSGTLQSIDAITLDDVKGFYEQYYRPDFATLVVVGDADKAKVLEFTVMLNDWKKSGYKLPDFTIDKNIDKGKLFIVDNPGGVQSIVNIVRHGPVYDPYDEYFKLSLANFSLGGMFNSRINLNLREDKGYTYGTRSRFSGGKLTGTFTASADVTAEFTKESIQEFLTEIEQYQQHGMTAEELVFMQSAYTQSDALRYETPRQKAGFLIRLSSLGLDEDYTAKQQEIIQNITTTELNALAAKWLVSDKMHIIVVGDAKKLQDSLEDFDRDIEVIEILR